MSMQRDTWLARLNARLADSRIANSRTVNRLADAFAGPLVGLVWTVDQALVDFGGDD